MTSESPHDSKTRTENTEGQRSSGVSREQSDSSEKYRNERRAARGSEGASQQRAASNENREMANVSHVHPYADQGAMTRVFNRGPVATDGGKVAESDDSQKPASDDENESETMSDVEHTPPEGAGDADSVFERGYEKQDEDR